MASLSTDMPAFPHWFVNGRVMGDDEHYYYAVGFHATFRLSWTVKLRKGGAMWESHHAASREEIAAYDEEFLASNLIVIE